MSSRCLPGQQSNRSLCGPSWRWMTCTHTIGSASSQPKSRDSGLFCTPISFFLAIIKTMSVDYENPMKDCQFSEPLLDGFPTYAAEGSGEVTPSEDVESPPQDREPHHPSQAQTAGRTQSRPRYNTCPHCQSDRFDTDYYTAWGGYDGPREIGEVRCRDCETTFIRETGEHSPPGSDRKAFYCFCSLIGVIIFLIFKFFLWSYIFHH